jgi:uncharacterized membrane protein YqjE
MNDWDKTGTRTADPPNQRDRSMAEVLKDIIGNVQEIIRGEVRLAKTEAKAEAAKALTSARLLATGAIVGLFAAGYILLALVYALALAMPAWAAAACVGIALALIASFMISGGLTKWRTVHPALDKTAENIKENVQWVKNQAK